MANEMYIRHIPASELTKKIHLTVKISGTNVFKGRIFLGIQLLKLAAKVIGCSIKIEKDNG